MNEFDQSSFIISSLILGFSYLTISSFLAYFYYKKSKALKERYIILLFVIFIFLSGIIHLITITMIYYPLHRLLVFFKTITAGFAMITALMLPKVIKDALIYKSPEEYRIIEKQLQELLEEKKKLLERIQEINHDLANRLQYLENMLASNEWISKNQLHLQNLKNIVEDLRREYKVERTLNARSDETTT